MSQNTFWLVETLLRTQTVSVTMLPLKNTLNIFKIKKSISNNFLLLRHLRIFFFPLFELVLYMGQWNNYHSLTARFVT